jgi:hypothetical protein
MTRRKRLILTRILDLFERRSIAVVFTSYGIARAEIDKQANQSIVERPKGAH